mgnify:CR=1 FL=1
MSLKRWTWASSEPEPPRRTRTPAEWTCSRCVQPTERVGIRRGIPISRTTRSPIFARPSFTDREGTAVENLAVELLNRPLGVRTILEFHECEPTRTSRLAIDRQDDLRRRRNGAEVGSEIRFSRAVRKIADEQTDSQSTLS